MKGATVATPVQVMHRKYVGLVFESLLTLKGFDSTCAISHRVKTDILDLMNKYRAICRGGLKSFADPTVVAKIIYTLSREGISLDER